MDVPSRPSSDDPVLGLHQMIDQVFGNSPEGKAAGQVFFERLISAIKGVSEEELLRSSSLKN